MLAPTAAAKATPRTRRLIAHAVYRFDVGGMENGLVNLINRLPEDLADHAVIAYTEVNPEFARRIRRGNVAFVELRKRPGQTVRIFPRLWSVLRDLRPSIFHTRNVGTLEGQLVAAFAGVPHRVHGEHGWDMNDLSGSNRHLLMLRRLMRPFVHHQIALSQPTCCYLRDKVGVPAAQITSICNGVDVDSFSPAADRDRRRARLSGQAWPADAFVVGAVGRFAAVKNLPMLIDAFATVRGRNPAFAGRARLALIGDGPQKSLVDEALARHGLAPVTWQPGERSDVAACLKMLDILCLPSLAEGISNALLEAMASGLPVVATRVGGNAELVDEGGSGYLVPSGDIAAMADRIEQYFDNKPLLMLHSSAARQRAVMQFSLPSMVERYHQVYARLLQPGT